MNMSTDGGCFATVGVSARTLKPVFADVGARTHLYRSRAYQTD